VGRDKDLEDFTRLFLGKIGQEQTIQRLKGNKAEFRYVNYRKETETDSRNSKELETDSRNSRETSRNSRETTRRSSKRKGKDKNDMETTTSSVESLRYSQN
jgi:hypothetical protein